MRADRLVSALLVLQAKGQVTAGELADELEVSVKTARRDLEALSMAGIPVYSQPGRNGGWQLIGGARTDLSGLTASEATTLFMIAGPESMATPEAKQALRKLVQALPETFRAEAQAAAASTVLDPAMWGGTLHAPPEFLDVLRQAVVDARQIRLDYSDRAGASTTRVAHPLGVVKKGPTWYVVATTERGMRTFRVERVRGVEVLDEPVVKPPGFDLSKEWRTIVEEVEQRRRTGGLVRARVPESAVGAMRGSLGPTVSVLGPVDPADRPASAADDDTPWVEVTVGGSPWVIARQLAGWGEFVDVIEPPEARDLLFEIGTALVANHSAEHQRLERLRRDPAARIAEDRGVTGAQADDAQRDGTRERITPDGNG